MNVNTTVESAAHENTTNTNNKQKSQTKSHIKTYALMLSVTSFTDFIASATYGYAESFIDVQSAWRGNKNTSKCGQSSNQAKEDV
jgi:hypothetical protein